MTQDEIRTQYDEDVRLRSGLLSLGIDEDIIYLYEESTVLFIEELIKEICN